MTKEELRNFIQSVISEIQEELDEITVTGNIDGYKTPHAFKKTDGTNVDDEPDKDYVRRLNKSTGYTLVKENKKYDTLDDFEKDAKIGSVFYLGNEDQFKRASKGGYYKVVGKKSDDSLIVSRGSSKKKYTIGADRYDEPVIVVKESINEGNRWQNLRADDSRTPNQKIGHGIREIRKQLSEIELFLKWYSKIKEESGLNRDKFWRRTNRHLEVIGNRIDKISERIKNL